MHLHASLMKVENSSLGPRSGLSTSVWLKLLADILLSPVGELVSLGWGEVAKSFLMMEIGEGWSGSERGRGGWDQGSRTMGWEPCVWV